MYSPYIFFFFFNDTATTEIYTPLYTLSLHDALPISPPTANTWSPNRVWCNRSVAPVTRSEEHTSELQSHSGISYAVFCLKKNNKQNNHKKNYLMINRERKKHTINRI